MAIALSSNELERTIEVVSSAAQALRLTRFESLSYRALTLSADVAVVTLLALIISSPFLFIFVQQPAADELPSLPWWLFAVGFLVFAVSIVVGIVSLVLNVPLFVGVFREKARL